MYNKIRRCLTAAVGLEEGREVGVDVVGIEVGMEIGVADGCANIGLEVIILARRIQPHDHVEQINA